MEKDRYLLSEEKCAKQDLTPNSLANVEESWESEIAKHT